MKLPDRFVVEETLGQGQFGFVCAARDLEDDRRVALKVLKAPLPAAERQRFTALQALDHPNLVRLYQAFFDASPPFFTMSLARGPTFVDYVRRPAATTPEESRPRRSLPLAFGQPVQELGESQFSALDANGLERLRSALHGLANGLGALHAAGFVHRDLSAENVRVVEHTAIVLDYGLCARPDDDALDGPVGTAATMAPEQWDGEQLTPAVDWYAVGLLLFEALTGTVPFTGTAQEVLVRKRTVGAPPPSLLVSGVPSDLDQLCTKLLSSSSERRGGLSDVLRCATPLAHSKAPHA
ncbi:MAG: serine/threonine protein kinase [Myxococcales bacterium]|nr:serine/threonine protein kinase [Myxococcales bacterium]MCB9579195.1 serine/threonine protein kinase [Polyangiaceae bacterium]